MKVGIAVISFVVVAVCCGSPTTNTNTFKAEDKYNPANAAKDTEPNTTTANKNSLDATYKNKILSYKDSVNSKVKSLKKVSKKIEGSTEHGEGILYLAGKDTLRMDITFYGETGKSEYVFYLCRGTPVFYVGTTTSYKEPINASKEVEIDNVLIDEVILKNKEVISWKQNDHVSDKQKYSQKAQGIFDLYTEVMMLLN